MVQKNANRLLCKPVWPILWTANNQLKRMLNIVSSVDRNTGHTYRWIFTEKKFPSHNVVGMQSAYNCNTLEITYIYLTLHKYDKLYKSYKHLFSRGGPWSISFLNKKREFTFVNISLIKDLTSVQWQNKWTTVSGQLYQDKEQSD